MADSVYYNPSEVRNVVNRSFAGAQFNVRE